MSKRNYGIILLVALMAIGVYYGVSYYQSGDDQGKVASKDEYVFTNDAMDAELKHMADQAFNESVHDPSIRAAKNYSGLSDDKFHYYLKRSIDGQILAFKGQTIVIHHQGESGYALTLPFTTHMKIYNPSDENPYEYLDGSIFSVAINPNHPTYPLATIWVNPDNVYGVSQDMAERLMSEYIQPSVRSLTSLNDYTEVKTYGNFQYRTLKGAQITKNGIGDHIYTYEEPKSNIEEQLHVVPITAIITDDPFRIYDTLGSLDFMIDPRRYTVDSKSFKVVWNDGKLGTLYDVTYASGSSGCLIYITRDTVNEYMISLYYDTRDTSYTKAQLVDMLVDGHIINDDGLYTGTVELYPNVEEDTN